MQRTPRLYVDIIASCCAHGRSFVVLIKRRKQPFSGMYSLPGGFVQEDERLRDAAARELFQDTGLKAKSLEFFGFFDSFNRDPRGRVISAVFSTTVPYEGICTKAGDDAELVEIFQLSKLPRLGFDHGEILSEFKKKII